MLLFNILIYCSQVCVECVCVHCCCELKPEKLSSVAEIPNWISNCRMSEADDLLIDLDNSSSSSSNDVGGDSEVSAQMHVKDEPTTPTGSNATVDTVSLMQSTIPIYKLLGADDGAFIELTESNPFDKMDKQAGLYNDPFELVSNAAMAIAGSENSLSSSGNVETGELISIDSPTELDRKPIFFAEDRHTSSPLSSRNRSHVDSIQLSIQTEYSQTKDVKPNIAELQASTKKSVQNAAQKGQTPSSAEKRSTYRSKSTSLNLLKLSFSNSRSDSLDDDSSPSKSHDLSKLRSSIDESFEDISATKPNWIDSLTDGESEFDHDIEQLNIPMLNKSLNELDLKADQSTESKATDSHTLPKKCATPSVVATNRDELMKKLELIKHKIPSPIGAADASNDGATATSVELNNVVEMAKKMVEVAEPVTPVNQYSTVPDALRTDNPKSLIDNLQKFIEKCDNREQQEQAHNLLQSLSSILGTKHDEVKQQLKVNESVKPKPIVRQRTFSIDKKENEEQSTPLIAMECDRPAVGAHLEPVATALEAVGDASSANKSPSDTEPGVVDPGLSNVIKELQQVWGNQPVNVLQANYPNTANASNVNPTYIVVMGTPMQSAPDPTANVNTPSLMRTGRSQSMSAKDHVASVLRATHTKSHGNSLGGAAVNHTPSRTSTLPRRSSFGSSMSSSFGSSTVTRDRPPLSRRSIQYNRPNAVHTPLTKNRMSPSLVSHASSPVSNVVRRKSLLASASPSRDSPQKIKTVKPTIMKSAAPPATRNLKIRVRESFTGRSTAPMRAVVPMNRVAPLNMINESVRPVTQTNRRSLLPNTPRPSLMSSSSNSSVATSRGNYHIYCISNLL